MAINDSSLPLPVPPDSGALVLYDHYRPALAAGRYRFVLQQTVTLGGSETHHDYRDQPFEVVAPRYAIDGSEVQACFPPAGGASDYRDTLPHLVLRTRSLPWERQLWPEPDRSPWLALLVLPDADATQGRADVRVGTSADLRPDAGGTWSRQEQGQTVLVPRVVHNDEGQTPVRLLDLDARLFLGICPRRSDLPYLAHVRQVDTADKVPLAMDADGVFAVVIANRFPAPGGHTVHLVSLEGWEHLVETPLASEPTADRVRLITLSEWTFVNDEEGYETFGGLMRRLRHDAAPLAVASDGATTDGYVQQALTRGYVPIDYRQLDSTATFAWYRGPFSPIRRPSFGRPAWHAADAALVVDDRTGVLDVSYASAWQLGRLLALSSPAFTKGLRLFIDASHNAAEFARRVDEFLELHRNAFPDLAAPGRQLAANEPVTLADDLVQWLARLVLLYPVPFHYLVAHAALLPPESLRFFHLDDNWVDALVDGALSVAVRTAADRGLASRADLHATLSRLVYQYRLRLQGRTPEWQPTERYVDVPKSGFLLRSAVVSGWPGVEVTVETGGVVDASDATIPRILRMDHIVDGVLLCLVRGAVEKVTFREPRESPTFGVNSDGVIEGRRSSGVVRVKQELLRAGSGAGVLDVAALGARLAQQEKVTVGAAELAWQLTRMPEEQVIDWAEATSA